MSLKLVLRHVLLLLLAVLCIGLLAGFGVAVSELVSVDSVYPVTSDEEIAVGYGLIASMALFGLLKDLRKTFRTAWAKGRSLWAS